jgi:hypothetical protein
VQTAFRLCLADTQKMQHSLEVANQVIQEIQFPSHTSSASQSSATRSLRYNQSLRTQSTSSRNSLLEMKQCPNVPCSILRGNDYIRDSQTLAGRGQASVRVSSFPVSASEGNSEVHTPAQKDNDRAGPAAQRSFSTTTTSPMQARSQLYPNECQNIASILASDLRRRAAALTSTTEISDSKSKSSQTAPLSSYSSSNTSPTFSATAAFPESQNSNKHQHCDGPASAYISDGVLSSASLRGTGAMRHSAFYFSTSKLGPHAASPRPLHLQGDSKGIIRLNMHAHESTGVACEIETDCNPTQSTISRRQCLDNIPPLWMNDDDTSNCEGTARNSKESDRTGFQSLHASACRTRDSNDSKKYSMDNMQRFSKDGRNSSMQRMHRFSIGSKKYSMESMRRFRCDLQMCVHLQDDLVQSLQLLQFFE